MVPTVEPLQKLTLFSIMPLDADHIDEVCEDIRRQQTEGVSTCALFEMTLVPEGDPPVDKVGYFCGLYRQYRAKLAEMGLKSGVLVQASLGHGWKLGEMFPFQQNIGFTDGVPINAVCPLDKGFRAYIYNVMRQIAACAPAHIMVDDDFRLFGARSGRSCGCPLHMKRFAALAGETLTREQLLEIVMDGGERADRYNDLMVETQKQSLLETARIMRDGIDSVDAGIPGSLCTAGDFAAEIAEILAGRGNPVTIRIGNGFYCQNGAKTLSKAFYRAACNIAQLNGRADVILAETDTCPQNRYSTAARSLHAHFTGSLLEGVTGAKQWITRLHAHEPDSGAAYREILSAYRPFYDALAEIVPTLRWRGCRVPLSSRQDYVYRRPDFENRGGSEWVHCVLERLGLPVYFSARDGGIAVLSGRADDKFSDEVIAALLKGNLWLSSDAAERLTDRGFGQYLGVAVRSWQGKQPTGEYLLHDGNQMPAQFDLRELVPAPEAETLSVTVSAPGIGTPEALFPGSVRFRNALGGTVVTFCGTPAAGYNIVDAFSFLNETRKRQLTELMRDAGELPAYYPGDAEVYCRAADLPDGGIFLALFDLSYDPLEQLPICCERELTRAERLTADGAFVPLAFERTGNAYLLSTRAEPLTPVILRLY